MNANRLDFAVAPQWKFFRQFAEMDTVLNFFPPYLGAGVHVRRENDGFVVSMPLTPFNTNYVGTHFGGSLYSMCDPFFMFILMEKLGPAYIVWDRTASIDFVRPGRGTVSARFFIEDGEVAAIREIVQREKKTDRSFAAEVRDEDDNIVAHMNKGLYIRRRPPIGAPR